MNHGFGNDQSVEWMAAGGTALNGMVYGPPSSAYAYGIPGCSLVPRMFRTRFPERRLPRELTDVVGFPGCKLSDLDSSVWQHLSGPGVPEFLLRLSAFIRDFSVPEQEIVIPAGVPFSWLVGLPLGTRLRNALLRRFARSLSNQSFLAPIDCREFLSIRNCGIKALIELLCVLESVELGYSSALVLESPPSPRYRVFSDSDFRAAVEQAVHDALEKSSVLSFCLKEFSEWAMSETDAVTLGSALVSVSQSSLPPVAWRRLSEIKLTDVVAPRDHPYEAIDNWVSSLADRERIIFLNRIACVDGKPTLQALADDMGVTRERIRQIEQKLVRKFQSHMRRASGSAVHWRAETIRNFVGVARPLVEIEPLLLPTIGQPDYRHVLLTLAGPYDIRGKWLLLRAAIESDPTTDIIVKLDEFGFIDQHFASTELSNWGLDSSLHKEWLLDTGKFKEFNGKLARWDVGIGDKVVAGLADLGQPATVDEILDHIQSDRTRGSAVNAISWDPRIVRVNLNQLGLTSWGVTEYVSISSTIRDLIVSSGGSIQLNDLVSTISKEFGAAESSVKAYCGVPMFVLENGWVSLRQNLSTFRYETYAPRNSRGVFRLKRGRVCFLLEVNEELLRGSGRLLPPVVGALLDLAINEDLVFCYTGDLSVTLTYSEASISPSCGSLRPLAETVGANLGDYLTVILNKQNMSVKCFVTDITNIIPSWQLVAQLTGVDIEDHLNGLAEALDCKGGEVRVLLKERGDVVVADAIPTASLASSSLEESLALLGSQLGLR